MKEHYEAVLNNLDEQERRLEAQLTKIRTARPAILALMKDADPKPILGQSLFMPLKYATMGPSEAMLALLGESEKPLETATIEKLLVEGGVKTTSSDFPAVVKSTLANLKKAGKVDRKEDGWVISEPVSKAVAWTSNEQRNPFPQ